MKKKTTTNIKSESESKSKIGPSSCSSSSKKKTMTTNSKATPKKGKSPGTSAGKSSGKSPGKSSGKSSRKSAKRQTDEEYMASYAERWKRENDYSIALEARVLIYEAEKKKHDIQEFRNRCESLDLIFSPSEGRLIDYYLRSKYSDKDIDYKDIDYCPIEEVDVNANQLQTLIEHFLRTPGKVEYCFTQQPATDIQGLRTFGEKEDVLNEGKKVGIKQIFEYCEEDHNIGFKIIEYQLDPAPTDRKAWFVCKLLDDESCLVGEN